MTLEQLISHKKTLVSEEAKAIAAFEINQRAYKAFGEPKTEKEAIDKISLLEKTGNLAILIKDNPRLKEIAIRHQIDRAVSSAVTEYREHQKWTLEAKSIMATLKIDAPIKDYLKAITEKNKLQLPWQTDSKMEKDQWNTLNHKIQQLAFIIDKHPQYEFAAKELGVYAQIKKQSFEFQAKTCQKISLEQGIRL